MIVPLELPLRASEAACLADLILQIGEGRPLADDTRNRILSRLPSLGLETIRPFMGSLVKDPTHGSTYYLAVDATSAAGVTKPFLLHMALSSAPASANFLSGWIGGAEAFVRSSKLFAACSRDFVPSAQLTRNI